MGSIESAKQVEFLRGSAMMYEKAMELVISNTENLYVKNLINIHKKELNDFCQVKNIKL